MPLPVVTRESPFINALERIRHTRGHQALVKKATPQQIEALEETIQNILENGNITTTSFKKRLRPKARHFREFVHKRTSQAEKETVKPARFRSDSYHTWRHSQLEKKQSGRLKEKIMATRMVLVPQDQQALAYQQKINISPQVRSLSNLDALMQHVLYNSKLPRRKRIRLYNQLHIRKQNILRQYGDTGLRPAVELAQPRVPPRRRSLNRQDLVTQAPSGGIAGEPELEPPPIPPRHRAGPRPQPPINPVPAPRRRAPVPTPPPRRPVPTPRTDTDDRLEALTQSVRSRYSPASAIAQRTRARTQGRTVSSTMPPRQLSKEWTRLKSKY